MTTTLIPPDITRCQAEKRSFMTLGPGLIRCDNAPTVISTEPNPPHGEMSLCEECRRVCEQRVPGVTFRAIGSTEPSPAAPPRREEGRIPTSWLVQEMRMLARRPDLIGLSWCLYADEAAARLEEIERRCYEKDDWAVYLAQQLVEVRRERDALARTVAQYQGMREALDHLVHLNRGVNKGGETPNASDWDAAWEEAEALTSVPLGTTGTSGTTQTNEEGA